METLPFSGENLQETKWFKIKHQSHSVLLHIQAYIDEYVRVISIKFIIITTVIIQQL